MQDTTIMKIIDNKVYMEDYEKGKNEKNNKNNFNWNKFYTHTDTLSINEFFLANNPLIIGYITTSLIKYW